MFQALARSHACMQPRTHARKYFKAQPLTHIYSDWQVERIALTEPDTLRQVQPLRLLLQSTVFVVEKVCGALCDVSLFSLLIPAAMCSSRVQQIKSQILLATSLMG